MHSLREAYIAKCKELGHTIRGDKDPEKTLIAAQKVARLGLSYAEYMELAFALLKSLCEYNGWKYPWYNVVISDSTINRIEKLINWKQVELIIIRLYSQKCSLQRSTNISQNT